VLLVLAAPFSHITNAQMSAPCPLHSSFVFPGGQLNQRLSELTTPPGRPLVCPVLWSFFFWIYNPKGALSFRLLPPNVQPPPHETPSLDQRKRHFSVVSNQARRLFNYLYGYFFTPPTSLSSPEQYPPMYSPSPHFHPPFMLMTFNRPPGYQPDDSYNCNSSHVVYILEALLFLVNRSFLLPS